MPPLPTAPRPVVWHDNARGKGDGDPVMSEECDALLDSLQTFLDGECPDDVEAAVADHLRACPPCLDRADFEKRVRALVASRCRDVAPAGLMDSVRARLQLG